LRPLISMNFFSAKGPPVTGIPIGVLLTAVQAGPLPKLAHS
jgi:hypothetical protein